MKCWNEKCNNDIPEPRFCCNGDFCGCMGLPVDPPFCSEECQEEWGKVKREEKKID